jgi:hypothetical protein
MRTIGACAGGFSFAISLYMAGARGAAGDVDMTFSAEGIPSESFYYVPAAVIDGDSRILAAVTAYDFGGFAVQRFNHAGAADTNFVTISLAGEPTALTLQKDGKILIASQFTIGTSLPSISGVSMRMELVTIRSNSQPISGLPPSFISLMAISSSQADFRACTVSPPIVSPVSMQMAPSTTHFNR